jgi:hypothetical protein
MDDEERAELNQDMSVALKRIYGLEDKQDTKLQSLLITSNLNCFSEKRAKNY